MSALGGGSNGNDRRAVLERRAAMVRERIEQRLEVLEHRRDGFVRRVQRFTRPPAVVVALVAVGLLGAALLVSRARRRREARAAWLGHRQPRTGVFARSFEKAAVSLGAAALHRLGSWGLDSALRAAEPRRTLSSPPLETRRLPPL